jgi:hypothetical protein
MSEWHGVPDLNRSAWREAFATASASVRLPHPCPVCGAMELHRYYGNATVTTEVRPGFVGKGASWEWCSSCRTYEHASGLVPTWWVQLPVPDERCLRAEPEELERQLKTVGIL